MKVLNSFSIQMMPHGGTIMIAPMNTHDIKQILAEDGVESCIGHADTARIVSSILGIDIPANRVSVQIEDGESVIVAQYMGPRLPEGAGELPTGAEIRFYVVDRCDAL